MKKIIIIVSIIVLIVLAITIIVLNTHKPGKGNTTKNNKNDNSFNIEDYYGYWQTDDGSMELYIEKYLAKQFKLSLTYTGCKGFTGILVKIIGSECILDNSDDSGEYYMGNVTFNNNSITFSLNEVSEENPLVSILGQKFEFKKHSDTPVLGEIFDS